MSGPRVFWCTIPGCDQLATTYHDSSLHSGRVCALHASLLAPAKRRRTLDDVVNEEREAMRHEIQSGSYYGDDE